MIDPAKPRYTFPFAGKDYELLGTFEVIEAVENALQQDIFRIANRVIEELSVSDTARLISTILNTCGHSMTPHQAGSHLVALGVNGQAFAAVRLHLYGFFRITLTPPAEREAAAKQVGEWLRSPGGATSNSA